MAFVNLTQTSGGEDYYNTDHIIRVYANSSGEGTIILFIGGQTLHLRVPVATVMREIDAAIADAWKKSRFSDFK
jgi:hypothetical protein